MTPRSKRLLFLAFSFFLLLWYFLPEITLVTKSIFINRANTLSAEIKPFVMSQGDRYKIEIEIPANFNLDISQSKIVLTGSEYILKSDIEDYVSFLSRNIVLNRVSMGQMNSQLEEDRLKLAFEDQNTIPKGYSLIAEVYLVSKDGRVEYYPQVVSFDPDFIEYFVSRFSYLIQYYIWFIAIFGFTLSNSVWSTVYDSKSKKPLSGAIVRVSSKGSLLHTVVTGVSGVINMKLKKGKYKIHVTKAGYTFPSNLKPLANDGYYQNLYYGSDFQMGSTSNMKLNIPLDQLGVLREVKLGDKVSSFAVSVVSGLSPLLLVFITISQIIVWPNYIDSWIFASVSALLLSLRYILNAEGKVYPGKVVDLNGKPVSNVQIVIYNREWNKVVDRVISNSEGEYEALLLKDKYYVKIANPDLELVGVGPDGKLKVKGLLKGQIQYINDRLVVRPKS